MRYTSFLAVALVAATASAAHAGPTVAWAVQSSTGTASYAEQFGLNGTLLSSVSLGADIDPRGIAVVGNTGYVSAAPTDGVSTGGILRRFDLTTGAILGSTSTTIAYGSLSFDGAGFWAADDQGRNAYHINLSGAQDRAPVQLSPLVAGPSGLEFFTRNGASYLIANRGFAVSATYDLYATSGAIVTSSLLSGVPNGTGVAYDAGTDTFVVASSDGTNGGSFLTYSFGGALLGTVALGGTPPDSGFGPVRFLADVVLVPEPMSLALLATTLGVFSLVRRRA